MWKQNLPPVRYQLQRVVSSFPLFKSHRICTRLSREKIGEEMCASVCKCNWHLRVTKKWSRTYMLKSSNKMHLRQKSDLQHKMLCVAFSGLASK